MLSGFQGEEGSSIMEWMLMPIKRYADFSGRSRRKEYWMFVLFMVILYFAMFALLSIAAVVDSSGTLALLVSLVFMVGFLALIIPSIAVQVRRCHDQGKTGWLILVPIYGFILMFLEGDSGPNQYGPDPKGGAAPETFE